MSPEMQEQARRWKAHPRFRWIPGMRGIDRAGCAFRFLEAHHSGGGMVRDERAYIRLLPVDADLLAQSLPDLSDPATQGLLLLFHRSSPMGVAEVADVLDTLEVCI